MSDRYVDVSGRHDPNDPRTAASPFAPDQPGRGVVADDVPDEQNPSDGERASQAGEPLSDVGTPATPDVPDVGFDTPSRTASKADWIDHAVAQGADRETAESMTKQDLIDAYGQE